MVFCNAPTNNEYGIYEPVTILILIDGFLQYYNKPKKDQDIIVTILILIDGFLQ